MNLLQDKIAVVTGGSRGIGQAVVKAFMANGAKVVFTARNPITDELAAELDGLGGGYLFLQADASSSADTEKVVAAAMEKFGRIDILVNNAGITRDTLLMRMSEQDWDSVLSTNLKSVFNYTKAVQSVMLKQRAGSIINLSSVVGIGGNAGQANYAASKAGVIGFTKSVAKEIGSRGIRCNAIAPGLIDTDMSAKMTEEQRAAVTKSIALKRIGRPEDVAQVALFLASDLSAYVTGQVIGCDGGM